MNFSYKIKKNVIVALILIGIVLLVYYSDHWKVHENKMYRNLEKNNFEKALYHCNELLKEKKTAENYKQLGVILIQINSTKNAKEASKAFETGYKLLNPPDDIDLYKRLLFFKILCDMKSSTYNYIKEIYLLEKYISKFEFYYIRGIYFYMHNEFHESLQDFEYSYEFLINNNSSDSLSASYIKSSRPYFIPVNYLIDPDVTSWIHEINTFRALINLDLNKPRDSISILLQSIENKPIHAHEIYLLYFTYDYINEQQKSDKYHKILMSEYPNFIEDDLHDKNCNISELFNKIEVLRKHINKFKAV